MQRNCNVVFATIATGTVLLIHCGILFRNSQIINDKFVQKEVH